MGFPPVHNHEETPHVTKETWREEARRKRESLLASIPPEWRLSESFLSSLPPNVLRIGETCKILDAQELAITSEDDVSVLLERLHSGQLSSCQVTKAYCKSAAIAHQMVNCLHELYIEEALKRAEHLDQQLRITGKPVGPLHGLPISLKDQFDIEGKELTMGYVSYLGRISKKSSAIVRLLLDAGAVIYCRTSLPQTLMHGETYNHIFGRTLNPYHAELTPGGSSGGEGALLAMKGSLGVGTDIGGSVRIPAAFCGLYALRPCYNRIPYGDATNSWLGQISILSVIGPMARTAKGLEVFFKAVLDMRPSDYDATALPFDYRPELRLQAEKSGPLTFGIIRTDHIRTPHPPIRRALEETADALRKAGHEVLDFSIENFRRIPDLNFVADIKSILFADGGEDMHRTLEHIEEPMHGDFGLNENTRAISVFQLQQLNREKEHIQQQFLSRWLDTRGINKVRHSKGRLMDGLICPVGPTTACAHGDMDYDNYTSMFNLLDMPAVAFPVTKVDSRVDLLSVSTGYNTKDSQSLAKYDPHLTHGLPVGLQVVGRRYQEECVLGLANVIEAALSQRDGRGAT